ncbi:hypothetical protein CRE_30938 [Caenorhabditis remanei]|uniref:Uncharacterized protein n=1 Tax=Caenorhabditis remanei TaxID=31234 RepID=E3LTN4_CAERE|nr:hypothetical protein CRE_30938 [Caenorhabditis remanei]
MATGGFREMSDTSLEVAPELDEEESSINPESEEDSIGSPRGAEGSAELEEESSRSRELQREVESTTIPGSEEESARIPGSEEESARIPGSELEPRLGGGIGGHWMIELEQEESSRRRELQEEVESTTIPGSDPELGEGINLVSEEEPTRSREIE